MKIGCIQITSKLDPKINLEKIDGFMKEAKELGCEAVFLPEVFYSKGNGSSNPEHVVSFKNDHFFAIQNLVKKHGLYVLGGSVVFEEDGVMRNRVLNFSGDGELHSFYDKINLFACDIETESKRITLKESNLYTAGEEPKMVTIDKMNLGLSVCFDLRYPQLYQDYMEAGANVMSVSSAFTVPTGKAHWHTLLRARAIETQSYVIASAQWGKHNEKMQSFGHSLIIDPWGTILADAGEGEKLITAELDFDLVSKVRKRVIIR